MASSITGKASHSTQSPIVYVLGKPGAGKGTLCKLLKENFTNIEHLSVGDHLRKLEARYSSRPTQAQQALGGLTFEQFASYLQKRDLMPGEVIIPIVEDAVEMLTRDAINKTGQAPVILIDGFPRSPESVEQAPKPTKVFFFDCPSHIAEQRFLKRARSADDDRKVFKQRCDEFEKHNVHILQKYQFDPNITQIGTERSLGETWEDLKTKVRESLTKLGATENGEAKL